MANIENPIQCSFCGKSHTEVVKLIAGPKVYICDSCINICKKILEKEIGKDAEEALELRPMGLQEMKDRLEILSLLYRDKLISKKDYQDRADKIMVNL